MNPPEFKHIGVSANLQKDGVDSLVRRIVSELTDAGFQVTVASDLEPVLGGSGSWRVGPIEECDMIAAIGGDGTILHVAREVVERETPILGLKAGRLGFLTEPITHDIVTRLSSDNLMIEDRMRIDATIMEGNTVVTRASALNDVVVHGSGFSRMVRLRTEVDSHLLREYSADGVILATPTGSTAYSLSAGGPLLVPTIHAILFTPLCPHSLSVRPLVLEASERIEIRVVGPISDIKMTVDGQVGFSVKDGQHVVVEKSDKVTRLVLPKDYDFFNLLREKL